MSERHHTSHIIKRAQLWSGVEDDSSPEACVCLADAPRTQEKTWATVKVNVCWRSTTQRQICPAVERTSSIKRYLPPPLPRVLIFSWKTKVTHINPEWFPFLNYLRGWAATLASCGGKKIKWHDRVFVHLQQKTTFTSQSFPKTSRL